MPCERYAIQHLVGVDFLQSRTPVAWLSLEQQPTMCNLAGLREGQLMARQRMLLQKKFSSFHAHERKGYLSSL